MQYELAFMKCTSVSCNSINDILHTKDDDRKRDPEYEFKQRLK